MSFALASAAAAAISVMLCSPHSSGREMAGRAVAAAALAVMVVAVGAGSGVQALHVTLVLLAAAAVIDARTLRIPNALSVAAGVSAVAGWCAAGAPLPAVTLAVATGVFILIAYLLGAAGAGDVKALPSLTLSATAVAADDWLNATVLASWLLVAAFGFTLLLHAVSSASRKDAAPLGPGLLVGGAGVLAFVS